MPEFERFSYGRAGDWRGAALDFALRSKPRLTVPGSESSANRCFGKAHTVMAEGGIAAALANVDDRDNWRVSFPPTPCAAGSISTTGAWRELHAQGGNPSACAETRGMGRNSLTGTKDGRILQRNFGGHKYPRLAHVGDRTGLEMIRTPAGSRAFTPGWKSTWSVPCWGLPAGLRPASQEPADMTVKKGLFPFVAGKGGGAGQPAELDARYKDHQQ